MHATLEGIVANEVGKEIDHRSGEQLFRNVFRCR
jgi:hypothetical protein